MCNNFKKIVTWNYGTFGLLNLNKDTSRILQCQVLLLRSSQKHEVIRQSVFVICCCQFLLCNACVVNRHSMILFCGSSICLFIHLSMCHWVMMLSYGCCCRCYISSLSTASFDLTRAISTATDTLAAKTAGLQWCWISVDHGLCPIHCYLFSSLKCVSVASYCGQYCCRIWLTADTYTPVALLCKLQFKLRPNSVCRLMTDFGCIDWCGNWLCFYYCCPLIWYIQHCTDGMASVLSVLCLQCFDAVGWAAGRASGL